MSRSSGMLPRSVWPLLAVLAAAVIWLIVDNRGDGPGAEAPGLLFPVEAAEVVAIEHERPGCEVRIERDGGSWRLGGTVVDLCDGKGVDTLLEKLLRQRGSIAVDAGSPAGGAGGYGLGAGSRRAALVLDSGRRIEIRLGNVNPATNLIYATGAGRDVLFYVESELGELLSSLPGSVRLGRLWPEFHPSQVETLSLRSGDGPPDVFARDSVGRWWLRRPRDGYERIGDLARSYNAVLDDRRRDDGDASWLRASDARIANLIFYIEQAKIRGFDPTDGLTDPMRWPTDRLSIRASFSDGLRDQKVDFGGYVGVEDVLARRNDTPYAFNLLKRLVDYARVPLAEYLETSVLADPVAAADSVRISQIGFDPVLLRRSGEQWIPAGDHPWDGRGPEPKELAADMILRLQRLRMLGVDPIPAAGADPLDERDRFEVVLWYGSPGFPERVDFVLGVDRSRRRAMFWRPRTGQLAQTEQEILSTLRNLFTALGDRGR